ncbi:MULTISPECIES: outer membrane protein [Rhodomicrobium]|uniref:outer membrane protein n=1 Tax=Rhodomicrobium TaxID=1068 RepID=UPI000B4B20B6|nr:MULTISPECIES: outer membrane protein [Rhodomicrobium]
MFRRTCALFSLIATTVLPSQLYAADIYAKDGGSFKDAPAYASPAIWSGFYIGAHAGYGWGDTSIGDGGTKLGQPTVPGGPPPFGAFACGPALTGNYCGTPMEIDSEGAFGGVQLGYNVQRGRFVFGVEGELGWLNIEEDKLLFRPNDDQDFGSVEYGMYGTLTLRAGYAIDRALVYAKGGLAFADIKHTAFDIDNGALAEGSQTSTSDVQTGWALGAGIEYALTDRVSVKAEYLYMDFGTDDSRSPQGDIYDFENALHTAKVGVNIHLTPDAEVLK